jgi:glycoside/pentoside/hexuronide:cation symporter, GPH family
LFSFLFTLVWNKMNQQYGLKRIFIIGLIISSLSGILVFLLGRWFYPAMGALVIFGIGFAGISLNQGALNADIIDFDELRTGKRRETSYSGMNALITKPAISVANWLFLLIIHQFRFPENILDIPNYVATNSAKTGILIGFTLVPALVLFIAIAFMIFFPLDGSEWEKKKAIIRKIHLEKEREYLEFLKLEKQKKEGSI